MAGNKSTLLWAIDLLVFLASHRKLVFSLAASVVLVLAGVTTCRHLQRADRVNAWMNAEFSPLGKSIDEILAHEGDNLAIKIPGAIAYRISRKIDKRGLKNLSDAERKFHAIYQLCAEAKGRGFEAYFNAPAGENAAAARDGFVEIGAVRSAAVVGRAMAVFPGGVPPRELPARQAAIKQSAVAARPVWKICDEEFLRIDEPLRRLLVDYAKKRKSEFIFR